MTQSQLAPSWEDWVNKITSGATQAEIGNRLGVSRATATRWSKRNEPNYVIALAQAYGADPVVALLVSGLLTDDDITMECQERVLKRMTTQQLVEALCERLQPKGKGAHVHMPVGTKSG